MEEKKFTIIIPTFDREKELFKVLDSLKKQKYDINKIEIILIDDGIKKTAKKVYDFFIKNSLLNIKYISQNHKGPSSARNLGIKYATGEIILFLGDDIIAKEDLILNHNLFYIKNKEENKGLLGKVTWSKDMKITPFMFWLENGGPQFDYISLKDKEETDYKHFYTCNVSLKKSFLDKNNFYFNENFLYPAYEDTEFAYRLSQKDFKLYYSMDALGYHIHNISVSSYKNRMFYTGKSRHILNLTIGDKTNKDISKIYFIYKFLKAHMFYFFSLIFGNFFYMPKIFLHFTEGFFYIGFYSKGNK